MAAGATNDGPWTIYKIFKEEKPLIFNSPHTLTIVCTLLSQSADPCDPSSSSLATFAAGSCLSPCNLYLRHQMSIL